jgi:aminopeptidase YwaD
LPAAPPDSVRPDSVRPDSARCQPARPQSAPPVDGTLTPKPRRCTGEVRASLRRWPALARPVLVAAVVAIAVPLAACGDESAPAAAEDIAAAAAAAATAPSPESPAIEAPDLERAMEHIRVLSVDIGIRAAGSQEERDTAAYLADALRDAGYETAIEEFTFAADRDNSLVGLPDGDYLLAIAMRGSPNGEVTAQAVHVGLGRESDLAGADLRDRVVIFDRGLITFREKALAAQAGGAVAVLIVNHQAGMFLGALDDPAVTIPVLAISGSDGEALLEAIGRPVTVRADTGMESAVSQNVVGRQGATCHAYLGAHYDSVPAGPGANDNASGVGVVLEVARVQRTPGLCVIFFGAEELGLFGSRHHVQENLVGMARFMLNVDMAGRRDSAPLVIGDAGLTASILAATEGLGFRSGQFPPFASSDHVSFSSVGVPAVTMTSGDDDALHTPRDTFERIEPEAVAIFLQALNASVDALVAEHAGVFGR